jgi:hypothetical protein
VTPPLRRFDLCAAREHPLAKYSVPAATYDERHAGCYGLILDRGEVHYRSPGHHVDGGSLAVILVGRSATRWLRLYG